MRPVLASLLALGLSTLAAPAAAAEVQPNTVRLNEVERGFWVGSTVGGVVYFQTPGEGAGIGSGALVGVEAGFDVTRTLQLGLVAWGQAIGAEADYKGITDTELDPKGARGDFQSLLAGAMLRWSFLRFADDNGIDRTFLYVRGAGGPAISRPVGVIGDGFWGAAGLGVEYFTRLRHFSIGLEANGLAMMTDDGDAYGVAVLPHLKYSF
ncbi:adventurous gliding motility protein CglE [Vulgatibacter sp.]|uniref:adventurous gliding motility protein CglE n=1 Tax=Vulgatibacter sp. TaxID=1971226 RepID=UPI0035638C0A